MKLQETRRYQLLSLFIALVFALTMHPTKAQAQIVGNLEADIPFQFHVGNAKLPPGTYIIHVLDNSDLTMMEISSADGSSSALFEVRDTEVKTAAAKRCASLERVGKTDAAQFRHDPWGRTMWMRSCALCKALLHKLRLCDSVRCQCGWIWWGDWSHKLTEGPTEITRSRRLSWQR